MGRLAAGATSGAGAAADGDAWRKGSPAEYPGHNQGWTVRMEPLQDALAGDLRPTLLLLFGSAAILLLITAVNLANMLLARSGARHREIAVRRAIGAPDRRLIRQLLTESLVLSAIGGTLGVIGAMWGVRIWIAPHGRTRRARPSVAAIDWRVVLFAAAPRPWARRCCSAWCRRVRVTRTSLGQMLRAGTATVPGRGRRDVSWWPVRSAWH